MILNNFNLGEYNRAISPVIGTILLVAFFEFTEDVGEISDFNIEITDTNEIHLIDEGNADEIIVRYDNNDEYTLSLGEIYTPKTTEYSIIAIKDNNEVLLNSIQTDTVGSGTCNPDAQELNDINGDGSESNPYKIMNECELQAMNQDLSSHYVLTNNINASETKTWNDGDGFIPIGNRDETFTGTFDGNNYEITDLYINRDNPINDETWVSSIGLFGAVGNSQIENVNIINSDITGEYETGGLVGFVINTNIENIYVSGTVESTKEDATGGVVARTNDADTIIRNTVVDGYVFGNNKVGGIVGDSRSSIINSEVTGSITGDIEVGGITGHTQYHGTEDIGEIRDAYTNINIVGNGEVGGISGRTSTDGTFELKNVESYGDVQSNDLHAGGIVGQVHGEEDIINAYSSGDVIAKEYKAGGLVAFMFEKSVIEKSYSTGSVIADGEEVGGFVGELDSGEEDDEEIDVIDSYWNIEKTEQDNAIGSGSELASGPIEGLNTSDMQGSSAEDEMDLLNFMDTWNSIEDPDDYPELQWKE